MGQTLAPAARSACALALAIILAISTPIDALAASGPADHAGEGASEPPATAQGDAVDEGEDPSHAAPSDSEPAGQVVEEVALEPARTEPSPAPSRSTSGQVEAQTPLSQQPAKPVAGELVQDGLVYRVLPGGQTVAWIGWSGSAPSGDVSVPATVVCGDFSYAVESVGMPEAPAPVDGVLAGSTAASLSLPASVAHVADGALSGCPTLASVAVGSKNESFASFDGMLFTKDLAELLLVPEGKAGVARIPDQTVSVPTLSQCAGLAAVEVGKGSAAFSSLDGILYTEDMKTLVGCPPGAGGAVAVPEGVEAIASGAFAGCAVASITALGFVRDIAADAFDEASRANAVVALPAGDEYAARRQVWEAAGFANFKEPAKPGDTAVPQPTGPDAPQATGLAYEVLDDYTLAVSWQGAEGPEGDLDIPATAEVDGVSYRVSSVAPAGFAGRSALTGVALPEGITAVGERAFEATGISDMWLPASVATVGGRAFASCSSLERIVALGATEVAPDALAECSGASVYVPSGTEAAWNVGLPAAGNHLLPYAADLPEQPLELEVGQSASIVEGGLLEAPESVEVAYSYAAKPLSVDPDGTVTGKAEGSSEVAVALTLDGRQLARAARAAEVSQPAAAPLAEPAPGASELVEGDLTYVLLDDGTLGVKATDPHAVEEALIPSKRTYYDKGSLPVTKVLANGFAGTDRNSKLVKATLPDSIKEIGDQAFQGCFRLKSIALPASVAAIGQHALRNCTNMTSIEVDARNQTFASIDGVLYSKDGTRLIRFPQGRGGAFTVPDGVTSIGARSFYGVPLTSIDLPDTLRTIEDDAFAQCGDLTSIDVPDSVTAIGVRAFYNNASLERAKLPRGLEVVEGDLFYGDAKLAAVTMPEAYRELGVRAFGDCASLESLVIPSSVRTILAKALENCTGLKELDIRTTDVAVTEGAFFGCTALATVYAYDTLAGSGIGAAFSDDRKAATFVVLPRTAASGATFDQMASSWGTGGFGFAHTSVTGGDLPMVNDEGAAEWRFEPNPDTPGLGTLTIEQTAAGTIDTLGWSGPDIWNVIPSTGHWSKVRDRVSRLVMRSSDGGDLRAVDADNWFTGMGELVDASEACVPSGVSSTNFMFDKCRKLTQVPDDMTLPDTLTWAVGMFRSVPLERFPLGFSSLPRGIVNVNSMFAGCAFPSLPDEFTLEGYTELNDAAWLFSNSKLSMLPENFRIPSDVSVKRMFENCVNLTSLPEGFVVPTPNGTTVDGDGTVLAQSIDGMFRTCPSLTYLPASFDFASLEDVEGFGNLFGWSEVAPLPESTIQTYYAGTLPASVDPGSWPGRHIRDASEGLPAGATEVSCLLPNVDGSYPDQAWCKVVTDASGMLSVAPQPEERAGLMFVGWYVDKECTQKFNFAKAVTAQGGSAPSPVTRLYGRYAAASGDLPTVRDGVKGNEASWSFSREGVLSIRCDVEGAEIQGMWYNAATTNVGYWGPFRSLVKKVVMDPNVKARTMRFWFHDMRNLVDVSQAFIPEGTVNVAQLFLGATSIAELHEGFVLPASVKEAFAMFQDAYSLRKLPDGFTLRGVTGDLWLFLSCTAITELPEGFSLPEDMTNVVNIASMFKGCGFLKTLPEGFSIPKPSTGLTLKSMFQECWSLTSLPTGFTVPDGVTSTEDMFRGCSRLTSLPEGFSVPLTVASMGGMFSGCDKLTVLPSSFDFPLEVAKASTDPFKTTAAGTLTYYAGTSDAVRNYDWGSQNRKLVLANDPDNPLPDTVHLATFKVPEQSAPDGWATYAASLTDAAGKVADPGDPARFGFPFQGWYADPSCIEPFDFSVPLTADAVAYAKFGAPILRYEVPITAEVALGADGSSTAADLRFRSYTPQPVTVKAVSSQLGEGASALVPDPGQRSLIAASLTLGYTATFPLEGGGAALSAPIRAATGYHDPGEAPATLSIDFKGAQVSYSPDGFDDVARLVWTVGL